MLIRKESILTKYAYRVNILWLFFFKNQYVVFIELFKKPFPLVLYQLECANQQGTIGKVKTRITLRLVLFEDKKQVAICPNNYLFS